jgi:hypothetical protein
MKNIMLTAVEARAKSQNDLVVFNEVRHIEEAILSATSDGAYTAIIDDSTMTLSVTYFNVWRGLSSDRGKEVQMANIVQYFTDLGYTVERQTNSSTSNTFKWIIYW